MVAADVLVYLGAALVAFWGIAHLFPTKSVIQDFGEISPDNKRILAMEWINEGATLIFMGALVAMVTGVDSADKVATAVYVLSFIMLNVLSAISLFTGFQVAFLPYRLCPVIFTTSSIFILMGGLLAK
jgi:hypothetical protein